MITCRHLRLDNDSIVEMMIADYKILDAKDCSSTSTSHEMK
jgi:hypothetical protein